MGFRLAFYSGVSSLGSLSEAGVSGGAFCSLNTVMMWALRLTPAERFTEVLNECAS